MVFWDQDPATPRLLRIINRQAGTQQYGSCLIGLYRFGVRMKEVYQKEADTKTDPWGPVVNYAFASALIFFMRRDL